MAGALTAAIAAAFSGVTADPYFEYTTLLLPGSGTNGAQNNTFLDGSTNNFTITRNGNTTQGTFSPFSQTGWGNYFDGTGDYLSVVDSAALELGSGDFCIEGWVYLTANSGAGIAFAAKNGGSFASWQIQANSTNWVYYLSSNGSTWNVSSGVTMGAASLNTWTHIALVRNSGVITPYINGVAGTTTTSSATIFNNSRDLTIGTVEGSAGSFSQYLTGYVSNFRLVVGSPVYTAAFTPPTSPLTAITNTALLTCQSNRFIDNSTNNFTITRNGDTRVVAFSPFNPTASWSAATYGGSGYFDGSGDYLSVADNAALRFGTGDFCFETWVYLTALPASFGDLICKGTNNAGTFEISVISTGKLGFYTTVSVFQSVAALTVNQWFHVALTRSGTTLRLFINGVLDTTITSFTTDFNNTGSLLAGAFGSGTGNNLSGYLSSYRCVKGDPVYTSNFTPPTAPPTAITNTSLLLNFTNAGVYDATSKNDLETVGDAQISNTTAKWGSTSIKFDGTGDYLLAPDSPLLNLNGDFTIEAWVNVANVTGDKCVFHNHTSDNNGIAFVLYNASARILSGAGTWNVDIISSNTISANTWNYIAATRSGNTYTIWVNGVSGGTASSATNPTYSGGAQIGRFTSGLPLAFNGYIQDLRITKGYARTITASPTAAFPTL